MVDAERLPLSRSRVVAAALQFIDEHGVESLSMRKLGGVLGVEAMSLYNHVSSKEDLLDGVADLLLEIVEVSTPSIDWETDVRKICRSVRNVGIRHPRAFPLLVTQTRTSFDSWAPILVGFQTLRGAAGLTDERAVQVVSTVSAYLVGFVLFEINSHPRGRVDRAPAVGPEEVAPEQPLLRDYLATREASNIEDDFEQGIELLLRGILSLSVAATRAREAADRRSPIGR